jgi:hypothetical protein
MNARVRHTFLQRSFVGATFLGCPSRLNLSATEPVLIFFTHNHYGSRPATYYYTTLLPCDVQEHHSKKPEAWTLLPCVIWIQ